MCTVNIEFFKGASFDSATVILIIDGKKETKKIFGYNETELIGEFITAELAARDIPTDSAEIVRTYT